MALVPSRDRHALILHRVCCVCKIKKPLNKECFRPKVGKKTGFRGVCIKCEKKASRE